MGSSISGLVSRIKHFYILNKTQLKVHVCTIGTIITAPVPMFFTYLFLDRIAQRYLEINSIRLNCQSHIGDRFCINVTVTQGFWSNLGLCTTGSLF